MNSISENIKAATTKLGQKCRLIAVSKTKPNESLLEAYHAGQRDFGENKVQELAQKAEDLPKDIRWHMIGHLQRNKVKYIVPFVHLIHGVDSMRLLKEINKQGKKINRKIHCLLQVHIAKEETKFGLDESELEEIIESAKEFEHIQIEGLMGMATNTNDQEVIRNEFKSLKRYQEKLKKETEAVNFRFNELSMGMSGDYEIAIEEGSTMVRIGSAIFGARNA